MTVHEADRGEWIVDAITEHIQVFGHPPTVRDLLGPSGLASTSAVHHWLKKMEKRGRLRQCADGCGLWFPVFQE